MEIVHLGDKALRKSSEGVDLTVEKEYVQHLTEGMIELAKANNGVGLAAPQVGINICVIVVKDPDTHEFFPMINPEITWTSFDKECKEEGCLSVLGEDNKPIHKPIWRYKRIRVKWEDLDGNIHEELIKNPLLSRIIQHETDHLFGKLFIDYLENN